ncbi:acetyl-CoA acetyltransferase [Corynebacterium alimapuense]|uniref:Acetyl-CoA acetyltransferase n=1 Tax=Corynebacterium alimapuense TaxID=1576874 RepID=A0A3M8KAL1_9CORY|nr:acetyl-CoA acetyltransferase [Corynebacterium alimapuense]RNE49899.1 acetyl-CoA acetyltransferase [Corynebacterium alimapuense]
MFNHTTFPTASTTSTAPKTLTRDPFSNRFGSTYRLPRGLREEAAGMSWALFSATYSSLADIRITNLETDFLRGGRQHFTAELTHTSKTQAPQVETCQITAMGPTSACTHLLADAGRHVEILDFHQFDIFEATVTFIKVSHQNNEHRTAWAMGFGGTPASSTAAALASGAQRIYG